MYRERSKIGIPALTDAQQIGLAASGVLPGHETQPRGKLAAIVEVLCVSDGGDQRAGADWSDAGYLSDLGAEFIVAMPSTWRVKPESLINGSLAPGRSATTRASRLAPVAIHTYLPSANHGTRALMRFAFNWCLG